MLHPRPSDRSTGPANGAAPGSRALLTAVVALLFATPLAAQDYQRATEGTRLLVGDVGFSIKMLVEAENLGSGEVEVGEITFPARTLPARPHAHQAIEIFYILEGELDHVVNGESHRLRPGMVGIVRPEDDVIHRVPGDVPVRALVIWAPGGEADRIAPFFQEEPVGTGGREEAGDLAFVDVTVIDGTGAPPRPERTVVIRDGRIAAVGGPDTPVPDGISTVDASGQFLIPGLWDTHVHPDDPEIWELIDPPAHLRDVFMPNFVAWGVTSVRDTGGRWSVLQDWRRRIRAGELVGPRIVAGGPLVDGPQPSWPGSVAVDGPARGRAAVDSLAATGVDFIKVYSGLPRDAFLAIVERAHERGLQVVGHVPNAVSLEEALASGMDDQHHLLQVPQTFADWPGLLALLDSAGIGSDHPRRRVEAARLAEERYDTAAARDYFGRMARVGVWSTPTLVVWRRNAFYEPDDPSVTPLLRYVPDYLRTWWTPEVNVHLRNRTPESIETLRTYYRIWMRAAGDAHRAGVRIMAGSDTGGNPHLVPGFSLHEELALLVEAGLSPMDALRTATSNPAEFMGLGEDLGTVEPGKVADLVLLAADPLADIRNTRTVAGVVQGGRYMDREALDALLEEIRAAAAVSSEPPP